MVDAACGPSDTSSPAGLDKFQRRRIALADLILICGIRIARGASNAATPARAFSCHNRNPLRPPVPPHASPCDTPSAAAADAGRAGPARVNGALQAFLEADGGMNDERLTVRPALVLCLVVAGTVLGLAGTDLVLPAVPVLPAALGSDAAQAQLVLAAYVGGTAVGLLIYGSLADRFAARTLFLASLTATAVVSLICASLDAMTPLIVARAVQGLVAAGPAVFAPGIIKAMLDETRAVRAMGALGSIESLTPAIAPIIGAWLLTLGDWRLSFLVIAVLAALVACAMGSMPTLPQTTTRAAGSYARLLRDPVFTRYALSQAFALGGLLTFVFGMPAVFVHALGGTLSDFIVLQVCGIATFIVAANSSARAVARFGMENVIRWGTLLAAVGALGIAVYAALGGDRPLHITALFVVVNLGFGLRGPPGFYRAVLASGNDDARGAALVILGVLGTAALGTVAAAPFVDNGLVVPASIALAFHLLANVCLAALPKPAGD